VNAKTLILNHFSPRYEKITTDSVIGVDSLVEEAKQIFDGSVLAAEDFLVVSMDGDVIQTNPQNDGSPSEQTKE
jgi:ribonuclease BN (tRNA processing enzyme)